MSQKLSPVTTLTLCHFETSHSICVKINHKVAPVIRACFKKEMRQFHLRMSRRQAFLCRQPCFVNDFSAFPSELHKLGERQKLIDWMKSKLGTCQWLANSFGLGQLCGRPFFWGKTQNFPKVLQHRHTGAPYQKTQDFYYIRHLGFLVHTALRIFTTYGTQDFYYIPARDGAGTKF